MPKFSQRSKDALIGVAPNMVRLMNAAIVNPPYDFTIIEGVRTDQVQAKYYSWGRWVVNPHTGPVKGNKFGEIVTMRDGKTKKSEHQVKADGKGHAVDICPFINGKLDWDNIKAFDALGAHIKAVAKELGIAIRWGGDFTRPVDKPHYELK